MADGCSENRIKRFPLVSVVTLNFNALKFVDSCLRSLLYSDYPRFEVIFVDNASTDGSAEIAAEIAKSNRKVKIVRNNLNHGYDEGNNIGANHARGEIIVFLNLDTQVEPSWLSELVNNFLEYPDIGAAQPLIKELEYRHTIQSAGTFLNFYGIQTSKLKLVSEDAIKQLILVGRPFDVFVASGAALAIRKKIFCAAGGFDKDFFLDFDEMDICWRIWLCGFRVVCMPSSVIYHKGRQKVEDNAVFHPRKNQLAVIIKNYNLENLVRFLPVLVVIDSVRMAIACLKGHRKEGASYIQVLLWLFSNLSRLYKKRCFVQYHVRRIPDSELFRRNLLIPPRMNHFRKSPEILK